MLRPKAAEGTGLMRKCKPIKLKTKHFKSYKQTGAGHDNLAMQT